MKVYEEREVINTEKTLTSLICDICEVEIPNNTNYYEITTSHDEWGNDSIDSINVTHVCNDECLCKKFDEYINEDSDTKKIEVEKTYNRIRRTIISK